MALRSFPLFPQGIQLLDGDDFNETFIRPLNLLIAAVNALEPPAYVGPLDLVAGALVAYGQRALSAAKLGSAVYTIRRDSDDTEQSFSSDAITGAVNSAAITAFLGGGDGFVANWTDQSGNINDALQATTANQPQWSASGSGSKPTLDFSRSGSPHVILGTADDVAIATGSLTVFVVSKLYAGAANSFAVGQNVTNTLSSVGSLRLSYGPPVSDTPGYYFEQSMYGPAPEYDGLDSFNNDLAMGDLYAFFIFDVAVDSSGGTSYLSDVLGETVETDVSGTPPGTTNSPLWIGGADAPETSSNPYTGELQEVLIYQDKLSDADRLAIRQNMMTYYGIEPYVPPTYEGPLDLVSGAVVAYGQRALSEAKLGSAVYTIRRDSDDTTQSFSSDATTGVVDAAAISAFIGAGDGFASLWKDQSGGTNDISQATTTLQPLWQAAVANSIPGFDFAGGVSGTSVLFTASDITLPAGPFAFYLVVKTSASSVDIPFGVANADFSICLYTQLSPTAFNAADYNSGETINAVNGTAIADGSPHVIYCATASPDYAYISVDGGSQSLTTTDLFGIAGFIAPFLVGSDAPDASDHPYAGAVLEVVLLSAVPSDADRDLLLTNIATYYGITLS